MLCHVYLILNKSDALECLKTYLTEVETKLKRKKRISILIIDMSIYLTSPRNCAIGEELPDNSLSLTSHHKWNGWMANMKLLDMLRSMMAWESLSISYWRCALLVVTYMLNHVTFRSVNIMPDELWRGSKPNQWHPYPWDLIAYAHFISHPHEKLVLSLKSVYFYDISRSPKGTFFRRKLRWYLDWNQVMQCQRP